jgi:hypothetical protein
LHILPVFMRHIPIYLIWIPAVNKYNNYVNYSKRAFHVNLIEAQLFNNSPNFIESAVPLTFLRDPNNCTCVSCFNVFHILIHDINKT